MEQELPLNKAIVSIFRETYTFYNNYHGIIFFGNVSKNSRVQVPLDLPLVGEGYFRWGYGQMVLEGEETS